jgi:hypothetical protein
VITQGIGKRRSDPVPIFVALELPGLFRMMQRRDFGEASRGCGS